MGQPPYPEEELPGPPHDPDAERVLLNTLLAWPENPEVPQVLSLLNGGEAFLVPKHKAIYLAFKALDERKEEISLISLSAECEAQGTAAKVGGFTGLAEEFRGFSEEVVHPLQPATRIHDLFLRRQIQSITAKVLRNAGNAMVPIEDLLKDLEALAATPQSGEPVLTVYGASEFLDNPPPEQRWLVPGMILAGMPTIFASQGGLGKSWVAQQLSIALASGKAFLDMPAQPPAGVIYLGLEDGKEVWHRRFSSIMRLYHEAGDWTAENDAALRTHLWTPFINWRAAGATSSLPGLVPHLERILDEMRAGGIAPGLVVIDTLARVSEGDENTVQALRPILNACTRLSDWGYTPLLLHHVSKGQDGARSKDKPSLADRMSTEWIRGSSSIVDNFRCTLQLAKIREDEAEGIGLDPDKARAAGYLVFGATKCNGAPKGDWRFLEQDEAGRWFTPQDGMETLARIRGKKAMAALTKQDQILADLYDASRFSTQPDLDAMVAVHFFDPKFKDPRASLRQAIFKLRNAGLVEKNGYRLTVTGLDRMKVTHGRDSIV